MNVFHALDSMEEALNEGKPLPWPMQSRTVVDKEKFQKLIARTRDSLPEEVHQARWISRETRRIAEETKGKADRVVKDAQSKAREILVKAESETTRRVSQEEIVILARKEAEEILARARAEAKRIIAESEAIGEKKRLAAEKIARETREDADRYAMRVLGGMENELSKILNIVKQGQESLHDRD
jgi:vacuolar-type H+-ATPase subunit H